MGSPLGQRLVFELALKLDLGLDQKLVVLLDFPLDS